MYITAHSKWSWGHSTKVKLLGEAAHLLTVVSGHSCTTSFVFSSTRITDSLVIPSSRGTSLFLPFIFSCQVRKHQTTFMSVLKHLHRWFIQGANARSLFRSPDAVVIHMAVSVAWSPTWRRRRAAAKWPSRVQSCLTAALLSRVSTDCQHSSMLFHQLSVWPAPLPHHYLPTENLLQLTWDAKPTLGSPPRGIGRTKQKLAVSRDGECRLLMFNVSSPFVVFITGSKWKALRTTQRPISRRAFQAHCS